MLKEKTNKINRNDYDIIIYNGEIELNEFNKLFEIISNIKNQDSKNCLLALTTFGGSPHIAYKIARFLKNTYNKFDLLVLNQCKSAGTIVALGADKIIFDKNLGELGPLDVQIINRKEDPLQEERHSGLDLFQGLTCLREEVAKSFAQVLEHNIEETPILSILSPKDISDIVSALTSSLFSPLVSKLEIPDIGHHFRAVLIAKKYAVMLGSKNLKNNGIHEIIHSYPDHGFVIDYIEAKNIFENVLDVKEILDEKTLTAIIEKNKNGKIELFDSKKEEVKSGRSR